MINLLFGGPLRKMSIFATVLTAVGTLTTAAVLGGPRNTNTAAGFLFVSDQVKNVALVYRLDKQSARPVGTITAGISMPQGLWVDSKGILYVANSGNATVAEYWPGATSPFRTLRSGLSLPVAVAVDAKGTVYVANDGGVMPAGGSIVEYSGGNMTPSLTVTSSEFALMGGLAIDGAGNLLAAYFSYNRFAGFVSRFAPGSSIGTNLGLQGLASVQTGLAMDASGNLYADGSNGSVQGINVYTPGSKIPSRLISSGITSAEFFTVDSSGILYAPNNAGSSRSSVTEYAPGGSSPIATISGDFTTPFGVAVRTLRPLRRFGLFLK